MTTITVVVGVVLMAVMVAHMAVTPTVAATVLHMAAATVLHMAVATVLHMAVAMLLMVVAMLHTVAVTHQLRLLRQQLQQHPLKATKFN